VLDETVIFDFRVYGGDLMFVLPKALKALLGGPRKLVPRAPRDQHDPGQE
jgi:hypothetical protein